MQPLLHEPEALDGPTGLGSAHEDVSALERRTQLGSCSTGLRSLEPSAHTVPRGDQQHPGLSSITWAEARCSVSSFSVGTMRMVGALSTVAPRRSKASAWSSARREAVTAITKPVRESDGATSTFSLALTVDDAVPGSS